MRTGLVILTTASIIAVTAALAHKGATGVVLERMQGMTALGDVVKKLTPMMRGRTPFDADQVRAGADVMVTHAGQQMTSLFPEGSVQPVSKVLPSVWEDWDEFVELAEQLELRAEGLKLSADVGLAASQADQAASMMGGGMMGSDQAPAMGGGMSGSGDMMTVDMFATMPTDTAFAAVAQTCSACHQKFRAEED